MLMRGLVAVAVGKKSGARMRAAGGTPSSCSTLKFGELLPPA